LLPDIVRVEIRAAGITAAYRIRHVRLRYVAPGFNQAHGLASVFGQTRSQHAARRSAAQNQIVDHVE
jgi:hypothetical protein